MKKKYLIIVCLIVLFCTGCNGTITRKIRESGFSVSDALIECPILVNDKDDGTYDKIRFLTNTFAISESGTIYELSLGGVYSNNLNCKKAGSGIKVDAIYNDSVVRAKDGNFYYLLGNSDIASYSKVSKDDQYYSLYEIVLADNIVKSSVVNTNSLNYYVLKTDGNIYSYNLKLDRATSTFSIGDNDEIVYSASKYGKILDFDYKGETIGTFIKSEDGYYKMKITNLTDCSKFIDVECEYKLEKDEALSEYSDRIAGFSGTTLITDYRRVFTANG